ALGHGHTVLMVARASVVPEDRGGRLRLLIRELGLHLVDLVAREPLVTVVQRRHQPSDRGARILWSALSLQCHGAEIELRGGIPKPGERLKLFVRGFVAALLEIRHGGRQIRSRRETGSKGTKEHQRAKKG